MKKLLAAVVLLSAPAFAAGFRIDTQSGRATGMGTAVSAFIDDASANYYNPAGLTAQGKGFEVQAGGTLIIPQLRFTSDDDGSVTNSPFHVSPPPHLYARLGLMDQLALGIGIFTGFGAAGRWPEGWLGRFRAQESTLQTFNVNLNLAYSPHKRISFGAGVNIVRGTVFIQRDLDFVNSTGSVDLGGGAWGVGFNGGVRVEVIENLMWFGGAVRSMVGMNFSGSSHFENVPLEFQSRIYDQPIKAKVELPLTGQFGLGFKIASRLKLEVDVTYVNWSSFRELRIEFQENDDLTVPAVKNWFDTASLHIGAEYDVSPSIKARLGFVYDPTPSPTQTLTPDLPDATRIKVAAGIGYQHSSGFFGDLGFQFVALLNQHSSAPGFAGTYGGTAEVVTLSLGFRKPSQMQVPVEAPVEPPPADAPASAPAAGAPPAKQ